MHKVGRCLEIKLDSSFSSPGLHSRNSLPTQSSSQIAASTLDQLSIENSSNGKRKWRQPALTSSSAISKSRCEITLENSVAHLEMRRFAERLAAAGDPISRPGQHLVGGDDRLAKQRVGCATVVEEGGGGLLPCE